MKDTSDSSSGGNGHPSSPRDRAGTSQDEEVHFAHTSEAEFAGILDFYGVRWEYEPRSFVLRSEEDQVRQMFTPDFYLPDLDQYIELTTLRQSLVTEKNRKLRRIRELYPDINIRLLYRRDYHRLLARHGFGPLAMDDAPVMTDVLFTEAQIQRRVAQLGRRISRDYRGERLVLVGVLRGVFCFMADLIRRITLPLSVDFMSVSYYGPDEESVHITKELDIDLAGRHVLMIEDIVDTGMTLHYLLEHLSESKPASLEVCTFLDKSVRRLADTPLKYVGFEIPDVFVIGYGLDYLEAYRNLPFVGVLNPQENGDASVGPVEQAAGDGNQKDGPK